MTDFQDAMQNPFSREKAYCTFLENMREASRLWEEVQRERAEGTGTDRELLLKVTETLARLTDNTILVSLVRKGLEARDTQ